MTANFSSRNETGMCWNSLHCTETTRWCVLYYKVYGVGKARGMVCFEGVTWLSLITDVMCGENVWLKGRESLVGDDTHAVRASSAMGGSH